jgi:hypothetical protein
MGVFRKVKQSLGFNDESLRDRGNKGSAKVLASKKTSMSTGDDGDYVYKTTLLVTVPGAEPYEVTYKVEGGLREGAEYPVYVDPGDPNNVIVGDEVDAHQAMNRVADALTHVSDTPVGGDAASIQQAVTNLATNWQGVGTAGMATPAPGLTPELQQMMADNAERALASVKDPAQRQMLIAQYRAAGVTIEDPDAT